MRKAHIENCPKRETNIEKHIYRDRGFVDVQEVAGEQFCQITGNRCEDCDLVMLDQCPAFAVIYLPHDEKCKCGYQGHWISDDIGIMICDHCGFESEI